MSTKGGTMVHVYDQYSRAWHSSDGAMNNGNAEIGYQPTHASSSQPYPYFSRGAVIENSQYTTNLGGPHQEQNPFSSQGWNQPQGSFQSHEVLGSLIWHNSSPTRTLQL